MFLARKHVVFLIAMVVWFGCKTDIPKTEENIVQPYIDSITAVYAPDKRVALFEIDAKPYGEKWLLKGETNLSEALDMLKQRLTANKIKFLDSIQQLPLISLGGKAQGIISNSVSNLRSQPKHAAELATQATLGTPVMVLKQEGEWYLIQTPDGYLAWVDHGGIALMTPKRFGAWLRSDKIIYTKTYGHTYSDPKQKERVSDIVAGSILEVVGETADHYLVGFPDGRKACVAKNEAQPYSEWLNALKPTEDSLVKTSKTLMGVPYLWGGTSTKGVDCSGFTKTVYFLNGMVIPRDASQQVHTGKPIDSIGNFSNLKKGDLLFFGRKATDSTAEKVVHVGMWIGNNEFIHSSEKVRISSMDEQAENYDAFNKNRYLRTKRMLHQEKGLINLSEARLFKD
ncbi:NlpC/P60 family protein [Maribacter sp. 2210JD10-5]|uniref:C40 family peptidase n=1 Tax=Maribacter sp. 2210JD10-5 TaxID=3386272 RepID=UPI0039BCDD53